MTETVIQPTSVTVTVRVQDAEDLRLEYADMDVAVKVLNAMLALPNNGITGWSIDQSTNEPCVHPNMFADTHAPDSSDPEAYDNWLETTRPCPTCLAEVPNRHL